MEEQRYLISEASRKTGTEAHVLRYWEEELALKIPRNELGHRYYTESHIELFQEIQELKNKGYSLKAIRDILVGNELVGEEDLEPDPAYSEGEAAPSDASASLPDNPELSEENLQIIQARKLEQFQNLMTDIVTEALARNNPALSHEVGSQVGDKLAKELNYAMREREDLEEARFKRLDEALRDMNKNNKSRAEAAAAQTPVVKLKKKRRWGRKLPDSE